MTHYPTCCLKKFKNKLIIGNQIFFVQQAQRKKLQRSAYKPPAHVKSVVEIVRVYYLKVILFINIRLLPAFHFTVSSYDSENLPTQEVPSSVSKYPSQHLHK